MRLLFRLLPIVVLSLAGMAEACAYELRVHGRVTDLFTGEGLAGVEVRVYRDGVHQHGFRTGMGGRYQVQLDNHVQYVLRFGGEGHVAKCFTIDTRGAVWEGDSRVKDVEVGITLFEEVPGLDLDFFDMPMGMGRFTPMTGLLTWNATYQEQIAPEMQHLMAEVRMRRTVVAGHVPPLPAGTARP